VNRRLDSGRLTDYLDEVLDVHRAWFPESALASSWLTLQA